MEDHNQTSFTFVVSSEKKISSPNFLSSGSEWFVRVSPKDDDGYFSMLLMLANPESLRPGLIRRVSFFFIMLNQSGKEIYRTEEWCKLFSNQVFGWGYSMSRKVLEARGLFETNKLIVKVEFVKVVEDVDWDEMLDFNGFQIHYSKTISLSLLYQKHEDFARNFRLKNQLVKTTYMNLLLGLIETLEKPRHSLTETELSNARSELVELTEVGFELKWLKKMLDDHHHGSSSSSRVEEQYIIKEKVKEKVNAARDWLEGLVHSWKGSLGFAHHHLRNYKKLD